MKLKTFGLMVGVSLSLSYVEAVGISYTPPSGLFTIDYSSTGFAGVVVNKSTFNEISLQAGVVGAPSLYFQGNRLTGLYKGGTNDIGFASNGIRMFDLNTSGLQLQGTAEFITPNATFTNPSMQIGGMAFYGDGAAFHMLNLLTFTDDLYRVDSSSFNFNEPVIVSSRLIVTPGLNPVSYLAQSSSYTAIFSTDILRISVGISSNGYIMAGSSTGIHTLSSCGTSQIYGGGSAFSIIAAGAPSGCTVTFAQPFARPPIPIVTARTESLVNAISYTITANVLTITQTSMGNIDVLLIGGN